MATAAQTLVNAAVALGYDALDDRLLKECLLYAAQTGGGGGGTGAVIVGSGSPVGSLTPTVDTIYIDETGGTLWSWSGAAGPWQEILE